MVGVDGSESSRAALRWTARQGGSTGACLLPVLAWQLPPTWGMPVDYSDVGFEKQAGDDLRRTVEKALIARRCPSTLR